MMTSLRTRLILGIVGGMVLLLTVFSLTVYILIQRALVNQFDTALVSTARILASSIEIDANNIDLEDVQQMPEFNDPKNQTYYQIWEPDGAIVARSPLLGADDLPRLETSLGIPAFKALNTGSDPQRVVCLMFIPRTENAEQQANQPLANNKMLTLTVARGAGGLYDQLSLLRWLLFTTSAVTIALSVLIAAFIVRRGLRPLHSIASEIAAVREDDLATRIGTALVPAEILPIKNRLNDLLSRLEGAFKRERRFTADVAHELRNPLAGIRSTIEVNLTRTRDITEYQRALSDCLEIVDKMQNMVNNLLLLARLDAQQVSLQSEQIRLAELVDSCWRPFSDKAKDNKITFDNRIDSEITLESDRHNLSTILSNVLENAVEYADKGGQIRTTVHLEEDSVQITVSNTGCQLTPEQAAQVFDRFWRGDPSRKDAGVHCGLGLALVERIITALGGSTTAEVEQTGIFKIHLILPAG
ncbi:MAG: GHKL domain-containing protein [Phycisphaerae bacterium]|nr:GHKL domain-containing protein [Phycisphaerae bacterium]NIR67438.1 GHKL domain-containing protein [candidate division Zixibacteria bacterium]NIP50993.1 GHKL domain-containing protein [Phycisphaerae bacterium]NIS52725.1 GHKL domain-containing protein [Phycisphaerae bacterium]NIU10162.1 GHKL domain-containing protein [Phycisphaerae bacterium]